MYGAGFDNTTLFQRDGYTMYLDEHFKRGVGIFIKSTILSEKHSLISTFSEYIAIKIPLQGNDCIIICCTYRSPNSPDPNKVKFHSLIQEIKDSNSSHILIVGDFNLREINRQNNSTSSSANHISTIFLETLRDHYLFQHVEEPTRYREHNTPPLPDLIITNEEGMVSKNELKYTAGLGKSDHVVMDFNFVCYSKLPVIQRHTGNRFNFYRGDYEALGDDLSKLVIDPSQHTNITDLWSRFAENLILSIEKHIPVSKPAPEKATTNVTSTMRLRLP